jgi:hypothetical protein
MVCYPFKRGTDFWLSNHHIMQIICEHRGIDAKKDTVKHFGHMDGETKAHILGDINRHWKKRFVMTNAAVTAGLDFNVELFHRLHACVAGDQNPREVVHWLSMARQIKENEVYVVTISQYIKLKAIEDKIGTNPIYKNLIKNCSTELANSSRTALECFQRRVHHQERQTWVLR